MEHTKILALCFIAAIAVIFLKQYKAEYAVVVAAAAGVVVLLLMLSNIRSSVLVFYELFAQNTQISYYFKVALKALGITYLTGFVADMCRDFGQTSLAAKAELAGRFAIFWLAVPLLETLLDIALEVAGG